MPRSFDERRVELARRISEVEGVPLSQAMRMVPTTKKEVDELVARLNSNHGADRSPEGCKIAAANRRAREEGTSFNVAARRTK